MKFISYNGYYKFYPEYYQEDRDIPQNIIRDNLVQVQDYFTFSKLQNLKNYYLKGESILGLVECPKTVETNKNNLENIFLLTNLFYNYAEGSIYKGESTSSIITSYSQPSLPLCGLDRHIIRGKIKFNKITLE